MSCRCKKYLTLRLHCHVCRSVRACREKLVRTTKVSHDPLPEDPPTAATLYQSACKKQPIGDCLFYCKKVPCRCPFPLVCSYCCPLCPRCGYPMAYLHKHVGIFADLRGINFFTCVANILTFLVIFFFFLSLLEYYLFRDMNFLYVPEDGFKKKLALKRRPEVKKEQPPIEVVKVKKLYPKEQPVKQEEYIPKPQEQEDEPVKEPVEETQEPPKHFWEEDNEQEPVIELEEEKAFEQQLAPEPPPEVVEKEELEVVVQRVESVVEPEPEQEPEPESELEPKLEPELEPEPEPEPEPELEPEPEQEPEHEQEPEEVIEQEVEEEVIEEAEPPRQEETIEEEVHIEEAKEEEVMERDWGQYYNPVVEQEEEEQVMVQEEDHEEERTPMKEPMEEYEELVTPEVKHEERDQSDYTVCWTDRGRSTDTRRTGSWLRYLLFGNVE